MSLDMDCDMWAWDLIYEDRQGRVISAQGHSYWGGHQLGKCALGMRCFLGEEDIDNLRACARWVQPGPAPSQGTAGALHAGALPLGGSFVLIFIPHLHVL